MINMIFLFFFSKNSVIDPMVIFTIHSVLDEQKYRSIVITIFCLKMFIMNFKYAFIISCDHLE